MSGNLLIQNVRPYGSHQADILIRNGCIVAMGQALAAAGCTVLNGGGRLALPGLVEAHTHLGTLFGVAERLAATWTSTCTKPGRWDYFRWS